MMFRDVAQQTIQYHLLGLLEVHKAQAGRLLAATKAWGRTVKGVGLVGGLGWGTRMTMFRAPAGHTP